LALDTHYHPSASKEATINKHEVLFHIRLGVGSRDQIDFGGGVVANNNNNNNNNNNAFGLVSLIKKNFSSLVS
jgi:hypothetical protein